MQEKYKHKHNFSTGEYLVSRSKSLLLSTEIENNPFFSFKLLHQGRSNCFVISRYVQLKRLTLLRRDQHRWTLHVFFYFFKRLLLYVTHLNSWSFFNFNKGEIDRTLSDKFEINFLIKLILPSKDCNYILVVGGTVSSIAFILFFTNFKSSLEDHKT